MIVYFMYLFFFLTKTNITIFDHAISIHILEKYFPPTGSLFQIFFYISSSLHKKLNN